MGAAAGALAIGSGIGLRLAQQDNPRSSGALIDADFRLDRYWLGDRVFSEEASFLAAIGGVKSGAALTIGPVVIGPELLGNPDFSTDVSGWSPHPGNPAPTWNAGQLEIAIPGTGNVSNRFGRDVGLTVGRAYRFGARPAQDYVNASHASIAFSSGLLFNTLANVAAPFAAGTQYFGFGAAEAATLYVGANTNQPAPRVEQWDDFTVREVAPVEGHNHLALAGIISGTAPAVASGDKVLFQADDNGGANGLPTSRNRVRLVWGVDQHLRLVVTTANVGQASLDLGLVEAASAFETRFSLEAGGFRGNLDGAALVSGPGNLPGLAVYRVGRSNTGEAWDGTIDRVALFARSLADSEMIEPARAFAIYGDSTGRGDHGTGGSRWFEILADGYGRARTIHNGSVSGQNAATLRAGLLADTAHRRWTTIIMDKPNTGETATGWIDAVKSAIGNLQSDRWLVIPPVDDSPEALPGSTGPAITGVQEALLNDPFFAGHTFDSAEQSAYLTALVDDAMRSDGIHFNDAGQAVQATHIRAVLDRLGF